MFPKRMFNPVCIICIRFHFSFSNLFFIEKYRTFAK